MRDGLELEAQVFDQPDEAPALPLDSKQRVDAHGVCRHEFEELDDWRGRFLSTRLKEMRDLRLREPSGEMNDQAIVFASKLNPANHAGADANLDPAVNAADRRDDASKSRRAVTRSQSAMIGITRKAADSL